MGLQAKQIYVNLPVKDLDKTKSFFGEIGFEFNPQFSDENAACMVVNENIFVMLLTEEFFKNFTDKELSDASKSIEGIVALSSDSREQVDEIVNKALALGGTPSYETIEQGPMYSRSFYDINGHMWEFLYMDESAVQ
ncbi:glyoxalase/bleomycin resistance/extradiol dioxygenase family protein [Pueribacillus theae]|uniref:Glyoxalase/bleomycin resistance/extradiol dioxygenase family protein n=1 Tax=Pueribacillus theae TaxID=2171751 RepID=A0A2U1K5Q6_9BACI|nr:VOC family protein [Pueribacillus theae]PWA12850.1 glyoxalase/bleomycin resistance/extradiol dioxygenase family protein [Pueribacillus theae]